MQNFERNQFDDRVPTPERILAQDLDSIPTDTVVVFDVDYRYSSELDALCHDGSTDRLLADGEQRVIMADTAPYDIGRVYEVYVAKVLVFDRDAASFSQAYIADLRHMTNTIDRIEGDNSADYQDDPDSWRESASAHRHISAFLVYNDETETPEKIGDPKLFDHLEWLEDEVDQLVDEATAIDSSDHDEHAREPDATSNYPVFQSGSTGQTAEGGKE